MLNAKTSLPLVVLTLALSACEMNYSPSYRGSTSERDFTGAHAFFVDHRGSRGGRTVELDVLLDDDATYGACSYLPASTELSFPAYPELTIEGGGGAGLSCQAPSLHMPRTRDFEPEAGSTVSFEHNQRGYAMDLRSALADRDLTPVAGQTIAPGAQVRFRKQGDIGEVSAARAYFVFTPTLDDADNTFTTIEDAGDEIVITLPSSVPEMAAGLFVELEVTLDPDACEGFESCSLEGVVSRLAMFDE